MRGARRRRVQTPSGPIFEFPISVADLCGRSLCFFGGGSLRLFPYWLIRSMAGRVTDEGRPVMFYIHPREIDPGHPRLPMPLHRKFKSYVDLSATKIRRRSPASFPSSLAGNFWTTESRSDGPEAP